MNLNEAIKKRASIKKYSEKKPSINHILEIIEASNHAPSPGNYAIVKYIIVEDIEKIKKISEACQQEFIQDAQILVVICSDSKKVDLMYDTRSKRYVKQHVGAVIENFLLKATELNMASIWIGAFVDSMIRRILDIPESDNIEVEAILPVGYPLRNTNIKQKKKPALSGRLYFETYGNTQKVPFRKIRREDV